MSYAIDTALIIKDELNKLPKTCRESKTHTYESGREHNWVPHYGDGPKEGINRSWKDRLIEGAKPLNEFICIHCHAIGKRTLHSSHIERVR